MRSSGGMQSAPSHPWWSGSELPLLKLEIPTGFENDHLRQAFESYHQWLTNEVDRPYGLLADLHQVLGGNAVQRRIIAEYERKNRPSEVRFSTGQAIVSDRRLVRGFVTAIFWLEPPVYPYRVFEQRHEARLWALEDLERGIAAFPDGEYWTSRTRQAG